MTDIIIARLIIVGLIHVVLIIGHRISKNKSSNMSGIGDGLLLGLVGIPMLLGFIILLIQFCFFSIDGNPLTCLRRSSIGIVLFSIAIPFILGIVFSIINYLRITRKS